MSIEKVRLCFAQNFAKGDYEAIRLFLRRIEWTRTLEGKDVYEMWNVFKNILDEAQNRFIPMKKRQQANISSLFSLINQ